MKFLGKLLDFQAEAHKDIMTKKYVILAHEMGLGKSVTSLSVACSIGKPTLIICPAYLRRKWEKDDVSTFVEGGEIEILSYTELVKGLDKLKKYDTVIIDEGHYIKNLKAKRTIACHSYIFKNKPECIMVLTGTPIKNRISEYFSLLQLCYHGGNYPEFKGFYKNYFKFCHTFSYERKYTLGSIQISKFEGLKEPQRLRTLISPVYLRKRSLDVIELPEKNYREIVIKSRSDYDNKLEKAYSLYEENPKDVAYMTLKAANALAKSPATTELAQNIIDEGHSVVIFTDHVASCSEIALTLGVTPLSGNTAQDVRDAEVTRFKKGLTKALVATIGVLSTGENFTIANYMIINDFPFVPTDLDQAEKRIHRIGQKEPCFYYYIFSSPIDKKIFKMIQSKKKIIDEVNNEQ